MNYKFSNRELILLKALTAIVLLFAIIYGTSYVSNEITKSKNSLFSEVNKFNETKQLLAQIKVLENKKFFKNSAVDPFPLVPAIKIVFAAMGFFISSE